MFSALLSIYAENHAEYQFEEFDCIIYNKNPKQGDAVFIKITPKSGIIPEKVVLDENNQLGFLPFWQDYIAIFAQDFRKDAGKYPIRIIYRHKEALLSKDILINYDRRKFDVWRLPKNIPRAQAKTAEEIENRKKEVKKIYDALQPVTPKLYILDGYTEPVSNADLDEYKSFGQKRLRNNIEVSRHKGVDISRPSGTPVFAPLSGNVVLTGRDYFYEGNIIIIDNGLGIFTIFCHLDRFAANEGDIVASGDTVGFVGTTGRSTGPHLHWQVKFLLKDINPLSFRFLNDLIKDINKHKGVIE